MPGNPRGVAAAGRSIRHEATSSAMRSMIQNCTFRNADAAFSARQAYLLVGAHQVRIAFSRSEKPRGRSLRERVFCSAGLRLERTHNDPLETTFQLLNAVETPQHNAMNLNERTLFVVPAASTNSIEYETDQIPKF